MPRNGKGGKSPSAAFTAGSAVPDPDESWRAVALEQQQELRLWDKFTSAMKLIKKQSMVYRAAEEGAEAGKVFVYPIIAAFGQSIIPETGQEEITQPEEEIDRKMRLVELLAVIDESPQPTADDVFRMVSDSLSLCGEVVSHLTTEELSDPVPLLVQLHDLGEYLQLNKFLCVRIKQLIKAEGLTCSNTEVGSLKDDEDLGPLLKGTLEAFAATKVPGAGDPTAIVTPWAPPFVFSPGLDLPGLLWDGVGVLSGSFLFGALGWTGSELTLPFMIHPDDVWRNHLRYLFGQALAGRELRTEILGILKGNQMSDPVAKFAGRLVEALILFGKNEEAQKFLEDGGIRRYGRWSKSLLSGPSPYTSFFA